MPMTGMAHDFGTQDQERFNIPPESKYPSVESEVCSYATGAFQPNNLLENIMISAALCG